MMNQRWSLAILGALIVYCIFAVLLIVQSPGLQYDEALLVLGSVHMRNSPLELSLPHDPDTWLALFGRWFPLMTVRYVGSIKEYLCLPLFGLFGPRTEVIRIVSMLLGALGIWGIAKLIAERGNQPRAAAIAAFVIAINPAYVDLTVFDNGTVAIWMGALGVLCLAASRYLRLQTTKAAFWFGVAMGLAVWARANFLWLLAAILIGSILILRRRFLRPVSHWAAIILGGVVGGFPFLAYQVISHGGTWEATQMFSVSESFRQQLSARLVMFSEVLLSDREHRAMWDGPAMPDWQRYLFPAIVLAACIVNLALADKLDPIRAVWARLMSTVFLLLTAILFTSRMNVSEHHLIVLVPLAAIAVVLASSIVCARYRSGRAIVAGLALAYIGAALYWQISAIDGLMRTGGVGQWSDGVFALERQLRENYAGREVKVLDWGLQNNLYVISDGQVRSREIFSDASIDQSGRHRSWREEVREGGVFVLNGSAYRQFPAASLGFLKAVSEVHPSMKRFIVKQRSAGEYAELLDIVPNTGRDLPRNPDPAGSTSSVSISTGDLRFAAQLDGFHQVEESGWRWTKQKFAVTFGSPDQLRKTRGRLTLNVYIPDSTIQKLGPITLTARLGTRDLLPETYQRSGRYSYLRDLESDAIGAAGPKRIDFSLNKSLPPTPSDGRELGIVVVSASLDLK